MPFCWTGLSSSLETCSLQRLYPFICPKKSFAALASDFSTRCNLPYSDGCLLSLFRQELLGSWEPGLRRSDLIRLPDALLNIFLCNLLPVPWRRGHPTPGPCACWRWVSMGHPRRPRAAAEQQRRGSSERGSLAEAPAWPHSPGGSGTPPGGSRQLLAHLHKAARLQTLVLSLESGLYNFFLTSACQPISGCLGGACCLVTAVGTGVLFLISAGSCLFSFWIYADLNPTFIFLLSAAELADTSAINLYWVWLHIHLFSIFNSCLTYMDKLRNNIGIFDFWSSHNRTKVPFSLIDRKSVV